MSIPFKWTISSLSWFTWADNVSFSLLKISTFACRLASHCFFRCRHFKAATLNPISRYT